MTTVNNTQIPKDDYTGRIIFNRLNFNSKYQANIVVAGYINQFVDIFIPTNIIALCGLYYCDADIFLFIYADYGLSMYKSTKQIQIQLRWKSSDGNNVSQNRCSPLTITDRASDRTYRPSYQFALENGKNPVLYRIGYSKHENSKYNLNYGTTTKLPPLIPNTTITSSQLVYSQINGLFVIYQNNVFNLLNKKNIYKWKSYNIKNSTAGISVCLWNTNDKENEKIFICGGHTSSVNNGVNGYNGNIHDVEVFNIKNGLTESTSSNMVYRTWRCGICEWKYKNYNNIICVGGTSSYLDKLNARSSRVSHDPDEVLPAFNCCQEYDTYKNKWIVLPYTNHSHRSYPCVKVLNEKGVIVVMGDGSKYDFLPNTHSHGGYIEILDPRDSKQKWMVVTKLRKFIYNANKSVDIYDLNGRARSINPSLDRIMHAL